MIMAIARMELTLSTSPELVSAKWSVGYSHCCYGSHLEVNSQEARRNFRMLWGIMKAERLPKRREKKYRGNEGVLSG